MLPEYIIVRSPEGNTERLAYEVQRMIEQGFMPQGGPFIIDVFARGRPDDIGQAMIRTDESRVIAEALRDSDRLARHQPKENFRYDHSF